MRLWGDREIHICICICTYIIFPRDKNIPCSRFRYQLFTPFHRWAKAVSRYSFFYLTIRLCLNLLKMSNSSQFVSDKTSCSSTPSIQDSMNLTTIKLLRRRLFPPKGEKKSSEAKSTNLIIPQAAMHGAKSFTPLKRLQQNKTKSKKRYRSHTGT